MYCVNDNKDAKASMFVYTFRQTQCIVAMIIKMLKLQCLCTPSGRLSISCK